MQPRSNSRFAEPAKRGTIWLYLPFIVLFLGMALFYSQTFPYGDDVRFSLQGGTLGRIWDTWRAYYGYGGARMGNALAQVFLMMDFRVWQWVSAAAVTACGMLFYYMVTGAFSPRGEAPTKRELLTAWLCAAFLGFLPVTDYALTDAFFWLDGSCNYLYPMFCALVGMLPFYNALRHRALPGFFRIVSPVFFVAGCLLHEQETVILFFFSAAALVYLLREKRARVVHVVLTILALAALIFMLTAPGAYFRMNWENQTLSGFALYCSNLTLYFYRLTTDNWVYLTAFGLLALWALHRCKEPAGGTRIFSWILKAILAFGSLYGPAAQALHLPEVVQINPEEAAPREFWTTAIVCVFWILFLLSGILALFLAARGEAGRPMRFFAALALGLWASQGIPALATASSGRAKVPMAFFLVLLLLCALWQVSRTRAVTLLQGALLAVSVFSLCVTFQAARTNKAAYSDFEAQIASVKAGQTDTIHVDFNDFDNDYFNSTYAIDHYKEFICEYYGIPKDTKFEYTLLETA